MVRSARSTSEAGVVVSWRRQLMIHERARWSDFFRRKREEERSGGLGLQDGLLGPASEKGGTTGRRGGAETRDQKRKVSDSRQITLWVRPPRLLVNSSAFCSRRERLGSVVRRFY